MAGYQLSVCAEMVFLDLPFIERVKRIHALGFGVEIWGWANKDIDALAATGARFTSMTGYLTGNLTDDDAIAELLQSAEASLAVAARLNCPGLNLHGTGLDDQGLPVKPVAVVTGAMWLKAADTLRKVAQLGERAGWVFTLENLNLPVDHPGTPFALAADTLALVEAVNSPALKMNLDLYHAQIGEGNLIELIRRAGPAIGEIQVADVPGRQQPGTGEINYHAIARALNEKILVAGIDGTPDGQQFVKNGKMVLTIFQDAKGQATGAVLVTKALLDKQKVQVYNWVPYKTITPENYTQFVAAN